jgi:hypothetical protein
MWFRTHASHLRFTRLLEGLLFGAIVYAVIAVVSTLLLNKLPEGIEFCPSLSGSTCIPLTLYALILSASWGPAMLIYLATWPRLLTQLQSQAISASIFGLLAGLSFLLAGRKVGIIVFLVTFGVLTGITAFCIALVIFTG